MDRVSAAAQLMAAAVLIGGSVGVGVAVQRQGPAVSEPAAPAVDDGYRPFLPAYMEAMTKGTLPPGSTGPVPTLQELLLPTERN